MLLLGILFEALKRAAYITTPEATTRNTRAIVATAPQVIETLYQEKRLYHYNTLKVKFHRYCMVN